MKSMSARPSRAPAPYMIAKRAPDIRVARSKSTMPSPTPRSTCDFGSKSNTRRLAPLPHLHVVGRAGAHRHRLVREVGDRQQDRPPARFEAVELRLEGLDLAAARLVRGEQVRGVLAGLLGPRHLLPRRVLLALELLHLRDERAPLGVERRQRVQFGVHARAARGEAFPDDVEMIADECGVEHVSDRISKGPTAAIRSTAWRAPTDGGTRAQGGVSRGRVRHAVSPGDEGAAEGDADAGRQADHPVRRRGGPRLRHRPRHPRDQPRQERHRGSLRHLGRARDVPRVAQQDGAPRRGARGCAARQRLVRAPGRSARPRPRGSRHPRTGRRRAVRRGPSRRCD